MDIRGEQFDSDSIDIELVGLDEKPAVPMSKFSLEKDEIVMKEVAVGDHDVKLALQLSPGAVLCPHWLSLSRVSLSSSNPFAPLRPL